VPNDLAQQVGGVKNCLALSSKRTSEGVGISLTPIADISQAGGDEATFL